MGDDLERTVRKLHERLDGVERNMAVIEAHVEDLRRDMRRVDSEHNATRQLLIELRADVKYIRERVAQVDRAGAGIDWPKLVAMLIAAVSTGALIVMELLRRLP